jgi:hypothetical protein
MALPVPGRSNLRRTPLNVSSAHFVNVAAPAVGALRSRRVLWGMAAFINSLIQKMFVLVVPFDPFRGDIIMERDTG